MSVTRAPRKERARRGRPFQFPRLLPQAQYVANYAKQMEYLRGLPTQEEAERQARADVEAQAPKPPEVDAEAPGPVEEWLDANCQAVFRAARQDKEGKNDEEGLKALHATRGVARVSSRGVFRRGSAFPSTRVEA